MCAIILPCNLTASYCNTHFAIYRYRAFFTGCLKNQFDKFRSGHRPNTSSVQLYQKVAEMSTFYWHLNIFMVSYWGKVVILCAQLQPMRLTRPPLLPLPSVLSQTPKRVVKQLMLKLTNNQQNRLDKNPVYDRITVSSRRDNKLQGDFNYDRKN